MRNAEFRDEQQHSFCNLLRIYSHLLWMALMAWRKLPMKLIDKISVVAALLLMIAIIAMAVSPLWQI